MNSLFGHLALKFSTHPENLATEALNYIINCSHEARSAFISYLNNRLNIKVSHELSFQSQKYGEDNAIPDLVATDESGQQILVIEAKFWAGLTKHQPVTYLKRLPQNQIGILLFIAPSLRLSTLWNELVSRCRRESEIVIDTDPTSLSDPRLAKINENHILALTSWRALLTFISEELIQMGKDVSDLKQLMGLSEKMDTDAFLPLQPEELNPNIPKRILQYEQLIGEVVNLAKSKGLDTINGSSGLNWNGGGIKLNSNNFWFECNLGLWSTFGATPFWLIIGKEDKIESKVKTQLSKLKTDTPPRFFVDDLDRVVIPLYLPLDLEKEEVVKSLLMQIQKITLFYE